MPPSKAEYAKINIACKSLGIDKSELIADRYGVASSTELTRFQTCDLMIHFKALGWTPKHATGKGNPIYKSSQKRKAVALWLNLVQAKVIEQGNEFALQAYVRRMTGKANLQFCDHAQVSVVIEALKQWSIREEVDFER